MGGQTSAEEKCVKREDLGFADTFQSIVLVCVMTVHKFHFPKQTCSERSSSKISHYKCVWGCLPARGERRWSFFAYQLKITSKFGGMTPQKNEQQIESRVSRVMQEKQ
jgi:hypothetical protein